MRNILIMVLLFIGSFYIMIGKEHNRAKNDMKQKNTEIVLAHEIESKQSGKVKNIKSEKQTKIAETEHKAKSKDTKKLIKKRLKARLEKIKSIENNKERFLAYKELYQEYEEHLDPPETVYDKFTEGEVYLMQRCIETECFGADFDSKCNIASVILNRLEDGRFGETITDIITSPNQFAYGRKSIEEDSILALEYVSIFGDTTEGALYFHSNQTTKTFNGAKFLFKDGVGHNFYK